MIMYPYLPKGKKNKPERFAVPSYRGRYKLPWMAKLADVPLHCTDKRVAWEKLRKIVQEQEQEREGLIAPKALRDASKKLLTEHVDDFAADVQARQRSPRYVELVGTRLRALFTACGWQYPKDISADGFIAWRSKETRAAKTLNHYAAVASEFMNWLERQGRVRGNPLRTVGKVECRGKIKRERRAFTDDEMTRLRAVAGRRWVVYLFALLTGLRRGECAKLVWDDVHLDAVPPYVRARSSTTKNHEAASIMLRDDLVALLREHGPEDTRAQDRVFIVPHMRYFKADLVKAGIPYKDGMGRIADFHALRYTLCTNLSRAGVAPRVAQAVMRHSDIKLTMNGYTDARQLPAGDVVDLLQRWNQAAIVAETRATGTDGGPVGKIPSHNPSQSGVRSGRGVSRQGTPGVLAEGEKPVVNIGGSHAKGGVVAVCHSDIKTCARRESNPQPAD